MRGLSQAITGSTLCQISMDPASLSFRVSLMVSVPPTPGSQEIPCNRGKVAQRTAAKKTDDSGAWWRRPAATRFRAENLSLDPSIRFLSLKTHIYCMHIDIGANVWMDMYICIHVLSVDAAMQVRAPLRPNVCTYDLLGDIWSPRVRVIQKYPRELRGVGHVGPPL